jgi:polyhydroxyalkanoate synthesis regulator phasin
MGKLTVTEEEQLNQVVDKIDNLYTDVKNNVLELADIIHQTDKSKVMRLELLTRLKERKIMKESTFSIFNSIGRQRILFQPEIKKYLPPSQNSLYRIGTKLSTDDIKNNVKKGKISTNSTDDEIIELINEINEVKGKSESIDRKLFTVKATQENYTKYKMKKNKDKIKKALEKKFPYLKITG